MTHIFKENYSRLWIPLLTVGFLHCGLAQEPSIALLKDVGGVSAVILVDRNHKELSRLSSDTRKKSTLRWVPGGRQLSYSVKDQTGALMRLVVIDLDGKILKELPIEPEMDTPNYRPRFINEINWLDQRKLRVVGAINNWNSQVYDIDWETGAISNVRIGQGDFVNSPDGTRTAYLAQTSGGPDETRDETIEVAVDTKVAPHNQPIRYREDRADVFHILSTPVWSEDSKRVAFLRVRAKSGEVAIAFLGIDGTSGHIPVSSHFGTDASLIWLGDEIVVRDEAEMVVFSHRSKRQVRGSVAMVTKVEAQIQWLKQQKTAKEELRKLRNEYGASEVVALQQGNR